MEKHDRMKQIAYAIAHDEIPHLQIAAMVEQTAPFQDYGFQAIAATGYRNCNNR